MESGGGEKPLGTPPGGGEEGAVNVMWRSFIQKIDDEEDFIWNLECEKDSFHREGARERFASWKERARAHEEERRIVFGKPSREEEKTQETLASAG